MKDVWGQGALMNIFASRSAISVYFDSDAFKYLFEAEADIRSKEG